jgi:hypothetical protein
MSDDWGPWVEHDGKGCPCRGKYAQLVLTDILAPRRFETLVESVVWGDLGEHSAWLWENAADVQVVVRYRIRRPRALSEMIRRAADLDAPAPQEVDA